TLKVAALGGAALSCEGEAVACAPNFEHTVSNRNTRPANFAADFIADPELRPLSRCSRNARCCPFSRLASTLVYCPCSSTHAGGPSGQNPYWRSTLMTKSFQLSELNRRSFLRAGMLSGAAAIAAPPSASARRVPPFEFEEVTIAALQKEMKSGKFTARSIARKYLARINAIDKHGPAVNSIIELNPDALATADALDRERKAQGPR